MLVGFTDVATHYRERRAEGLSNISNVWFPLFKPSIGEGILNQVGKQHHLISSFHEFFQS